MPITTKQAAPPSFLQRFRTITENYLFSVAQKDMLKHAEDPYSRPPAAKKEFIYRLLPFIFLPGYTLTPWPLKRRLLSLFFVHRPQHWPDKPWETQDSP